MTLTRASRAEVGGDDTLPPADRRRTILIVAAATVALALLATWLVAFSSVFGVRNVEVRGVHVLTADQVRAAADISNGTPLVRLDTSAITSRVEQLPEVASAQVSTSFPSTVVIVVEERIAVGYTLRNGHAVLVDSSGAEYRTVNEPPAGLPHFVLPAGAQQRPTAAAVAAVATALPRAVVREVRSIDALNPSRITLVLAGHRLVQWGSADQTAFKARLLPALLRRPVGYVDLTNPSEPFTRR
jgi:cell division protein FtsQ